MARRNSYKHVSISKLVHYLGLDPFYATEDPGVESLIMDVYTNRAHDRRFLEFNRQFNRWPCKDIDHLHLVYLWMGLGLPAYLDGDPIGWVFNRRNSLHFWQWEITFDEDELKEFLRDHGYFLPVYFYPDEPDNTVNQKVLELASCDENKEASGTTKTHPLIRFHEMKNLRFNEITIGIDPENLSLKLSARSTRISAAFSHLGLLKKNEVSLNKQGEVLFEMANHSLNRSGPGVSRAIVRLSKSLREAFGTSDTPFKNEIPRFKLKIYKDHRAKEQAMKRTVEFDGEKALPDDIDPTAEWLKRHDPNFNSDEGA